MSIYIFYPPSRREGTVRVSNAASGVCVGAGPAVSPFYFLVFNFVFQMSQGSRVPFTSKLYCKENVSLLTACAAARCLACRFFFVFFVLSFASSFAQILPRCRLFLFFPSQTLTSPLAQQKNVCLKLLFFFFFRRIVGKARAPAFSFWFGVMAGRCSFRYTFLFGHQLSQMFASLRLL